MIWDHCGHSWWKLVLSVSTLLCQAKPTPSPIRLRLLKYFFFSMSDTFCWGKETAYRPHQRQEQFRGALCVLPIFCFPRKWEDEWDTGMKPFLLWRAAVGDFPGLKLSKWALYVAEIYLQTGNTEHCWQNTCFELLGYNNLWGTFWARIRRCLLKLASPPLSYALLAVAKVLITTPVHEDGLLA